MLVIVIGLGGDPKGIHTGRFPASTILLTPSKAATENTQLAGRSRIEGEIILTSGM